MGSAARGTPQGHCNRRDGPWRMLWAAKVNSRRVGRISRIPEVRSVRNEDFLRDTLARKPHAKYRGVNQIIFLTRHTFGMRVFSIYSPLRCALRQARDRRDDLEWGWADAVKCVARGSSPGVAARVLRTRSTNMIVAVLALRCVFVFTQQCAVMLAQRCAVALADVGRIVVFAHVGCIVVLMHVGCMVSICCPASICRTALFCCAGWP